MSNFTVNGIYSYTRSDVYRYIGSYPTNENKLKEVLNVTKEIINILK